MKMWVKENRNSFTSLTEFGLPEVTFSPGGIRQMILTPALQNAIDAGYIIEVQPIWNELHTAITGFAEKEGIVNAIHTEC